MKLENEFVVPVPSTNQRARQPVYEVAHAVATKLGKPCFDNMVSKKAPIGETRSLKNLRTKEEKIASLDGQVVVNNVISNDGCWNVLVVDDLYDSGATLEEVCKQLRSYSKVGKIFVTTLTWR